MKRKVSLLYLLLMLFLALPLPARGWSGKVIGVPAGDTITVLRGEQPVRVRLYGIDCIDCKGVKSPFDSCMTTLEAKS